MFVVSSLLLLVIVSYIKFLCSGSCFCCLGFLGFIKCYQLALFLFLFVVFVFWGGFKGQVRWPKGPPHLALNPPYLFSLVFGLVCFLLCSYRV